MKVIIGVFLTLSLSLFLVSADPLTIKPISDGGTASGTALTNGKIMYSTSGAIVEAPYLKNIGGQDLTISDAGATSVVMDSRTKLNLIGVNSNYTNGPAIHTYTSTDNHPLFEVLPYAHNDVSLNFDLYWNGTWRSSNVNANYQITKYINRLNFNYGSGASQGNGPSLGTSFYVPISGKATFVQPIKLSSTGATASDLSVYSETYWTAKVIPYNASSEDEEYTIYIDIRFQRVNNMVTMTIPRFGNLTILNYKNPVIRFMSAPSNTPPLSVPSYFMPATGTTIARLFRLYLSSAQTDASGTSINYSTNHTIGKLVMVVGSNIVDIKLTPLSNSYSLYTHVYPLFPPAQFPASLLAGPVYDTTIEYQV